MSGHRPIKFPRRFGLPPFGCHGLPAICLTDLMLDAATTQLLAAQDGDPVGFERFVQLTVGDVTRFCRYLGDANHVDDLVQDTYLRALRSLNTYRGDTTGVRWLISIARRACADAIECNERARRPELTRRVDRDAPSVVEIEILIDRLPNEQRIAFALTQLLGYSYAEAADLCACPVGTIRSRVARARTQLAESMVGIECAS